MKLPFFYERSRRDSFNFELDTLAKMMNLVCYVLMNRPFCLNNPIIYGKKLLRTGQFC